MAPTSSSSSTFAPTLPLCIVTASSHSKVGQEDLPEYLKSFHDSGISEARLKKFNWLHPRNYSGDGSLSDDHTLSPYGTSVSSPRGDAWEVVEPGPRKSIDELWDEVFEYQQRKRLLEEIQRVQDEAAAATAAQLHYTPNLDQIEEEEHQEYEGEGDDDGEDGGDKTKPSRLSRVHK
ncbi:hypothetical protein BGX31_000955 [Mortierella sp. GBA43]|nr:hypothetical protein BGX31_000955 [Mortierella sp. GBA43]